MPFRKHRESSISECDSAAAFVERVQIIQNNILSITLIQTMLYPLFMYMFWGKVDAYLLWFWSAFFVLGMGTRTFLTLKCRKAKIDIKTAGYWARRMMWGTVMTGLVWSTGCLMLEIFASHQYRGFTAFILGGMAVAGVSVSSAVLSIYRVYLFALLLPITSYYLIAAPEGSRMLGYLTPVLFAGMWLLSKRYNNFIKKSLSLRYENMRMVDEFSLANTILMQNKQRFEDIARATGDWIWEINANNVYTYASDKIRDILGYNPEEMLGKTPFDLKPPKEAARVKAEYEMFLQSGEDILKIESWNLTKTGGLVCLSSTCLTMRNTRGDFIGVRGVSRDITRQKREERDREMLEIGLRQIQKMQATGHLAAGVAHEINTPVQFVSDNTRFLKDAMTDYAELAQGCVDLIRAAKAGPVPTDLLESLSNLSDDIDVEELNADVIEALDRSTEGLGRIGRIVNAMREFSQPANTEKIQTDLRKNITSCIEISRHEWNHLAEIHVTFDNAMPEVPVMPSDFNQVILNMILNAMHAIQDVHKPEEGKTGRINIRTIKSGDWAVIEITDNGAGIPRELHTRIFDPFFSTRDVGNGSGQGLSHAWSVIVERHQGAIDVRSTPGKGATFSLKLPLKQLVAV